MLGDFNIHVEKETDSKTITLINLLSSMHFIQLVTGPTHNRGHILDMVNNKGLSIDISCIVYVALSDHHCVFFTTLLPIAQSNTERIVKKHYLSQKLLQTYSASSCDDLVDNFNSKLRATIDPVKLKRATSKWRAPWMSEETNALKGNCRKAERKWRNSKLQVHYDILREQFGQYNKAIRKARRANVSNFRMI